MKITIRASDIKHGRVREPRFCPVALAAKRAFKNMVFVGGRRLEVKKEGRRLIKLLPLVARKFIRAFDNSRKVKPFSFTL